MFCGMTLLPILQKRPCRHPTDHDAEAECTYSYPDCAGNLAMRLRKVGLYFRRSAYTSAERWPRS